MGLVAPLPKLVLRPEPWLGSTIYILKTVLESCKISFPSTLNCSDSTWVRDQTDESNRSDEASDWVRLGVHSQPTAHFVNSAKVCGILGANSADWAGYADLADS